MRFAALGRTRWLYDSIVLALSRGHKVALIGTCAASPEYSLQERDFESLAASVGCPFFNDHKINQAKYIAMARESGAEIAISVNWLTLISQEMINQFPCGIVNAHAGDLPRYRGNACPNWAILNNDTEIVVTLHQMVPELDAGPVLLKRRFQIDRATYIGDIYRFMDRNVPEMFVEALDGYSSNQITPKPQPKDSDLALRCYPRMPEDGEIDWSRSAGDISALVRASAEPFAGAYTFLDGQRVIVWRARSELAPCPSLGIPGQVCEIRREPGEVAVFAGSGWVILEEVQTEQAGRVPANKITQSTRQRFENGIGSRIKTLEARIAVLQAAVENLDKHALGKAEE